MPAIDEHLIQELRDQLASIRLSWCEIVAAQGKVGEDQVRRVSCQLFTDSFATWAYRVVEAFGQDAFPTYCREPECFPEELESMLESDELPRVITGVKDPVQAGLRIILWGRAFKDPVLLIGEKDWYYKRDFEESIRKWVRVGFVFQVNESWRVRLEPIDWVGNAFESLELDWQESQIADGTSLTVAEIARYLFKNHDETHKRQIREWIDRGKLKAVKRGKGRATSYFVSQLQLDSLRESMKK